MCPAELRTVTTPTIPTICRVTKPWKKATAALSRRRRESSSGVFGVVTRWRRFLVVVAATALLAPMQRHLAAQGRITPFQVGDRILLHVEGDSALSDTFTVVAGPALRLPNIGDISLAGIPRANLETHLTTELGRYIKDPVVQARALIRVSVAGEVGKPGYYAVPIDLVLADALMLAGGATKDARVDQLKIMRGSSELWTGDRLQ